MDAKDAKDAKATTPDPATAATITVGDGDGTQVFGWVGKGRMDTKTKAATKTAPAITSRTLTLWATKDPETKVIGTGIFDGSAWVDHITLTGDALAALITSIGGDAKVGTFVRAAKARAGRGDLTTILLPALAALGSETRHVTFAVTDDAKAKAIADRAKAATI